MAQFDIHRFADRMLVIDLQSDLIGVLATRLVAPVYPFDKASQHITRLNPTITINGEKYYIAMQEA